MKIEGLISLIKRYIIHIHAHVVVQLVVCARVLYSNIKLFNVYIVQS